MSLEFYPPNDLLRNTTNVSERLDLLSKAAEEFKAIIIGRLDLSLEKQMVKTPREQTIAFNWEEIARLLREIRSMPEINRNDKLMKATHLKQLAEIYEILRAAKMSKLEAVRIALISEANQLNNQATQVA